MPARYAEHEIREAAFRALTDKDVAILRDRRGGDTKPMTLAVFRERLDARQEFDEDDEGGCNCFAPPED